MSVEGNFDLEKDTSSMSIWTTSPNVFSIITHYLESCTQPFISCHSFYNQFSLLGRRPSFIRPLSFHHPVDLL